MPCLLLALLTLAFYNPVIHNGFTNFDDDFYIVHNPRVQSGLTWDTAKWAFTTYYFSNWHPITWMSYALDCRLFKLNPAGHHYESVLFHAGNVILLFLLLESATGLIWPSLIVAGLFALHPVNVESVAWAAERKNVLSMFFFLLTLHAYGWYVRRVSIKRYVAVAGLFALGLMAKSEIITLPFVLLLWDYWPLHRMSSGISDSSQQRMSLLRLSLEKLPLLFLSAISAIMTIQAQAASGSMPTMDLRWRIGNAIVAYSRYMGLALWPTNLAVLYPHPGILLAGWKVIASAILVLLLTALVLLCKNRRYLAVGWFWFLGTLIPVIGIIQVGQQAMADRYAYLPFIGLFMAMVWGIADVMGGLRVSPAWLGGPAVLVLILFGFLTNRQLDNWRDSETLWRHALSVTENNYVAHDNLARALAAKGDAQAAIAEFKAADSLNWYTPQEMLEVGLYEQAHGDSKDAADEYERSLRRMRDPESRAVALCFLGSSLMRVGDSVRAGQSYAEALRESPNNEMALVGSGLLAEREGDIPLAIDQISHALSVRPGDVGYLLLADALRREGRLVEATSAEVHAKQISSNWTQAQQSAAQALAAAGLGPQ